MNQNFDKFFIIAIVILFGWYIFHLIDKNSENKYKVIINKEPLNVCGKDIYITNHSYNDEILIYELIDEIECICKNQC